MAAGFAGAAGGGGPALARLARGIGRDGRALLGRPTTGRRRCGSRVAGRFGFTVLGLARGPRFDFTVGRRHHFFFPSNFILMYLICFVFFLEEVDSGRSGAGRCRLRMSFDFLFPGRFDFLFLGCCSPSGVQLNRQHLCNWSKKMANEMISFEWTISIDAIHQH